MDKIVFYLQGYHEGFVLRLEYSISLFLDKRDRHIFNSQEFGDVLRHVAKNCSNFSKVPLLQHGRVGKLFWTAGYYSAFWRSSITRLTNSLSSPCWIKALICLFRWMHSDLRWIINVCSSWKVFTLLGSFYSQVEDIFSF